MHRKFIATVLTSAIAFGAGAALAQSQGDMTFGIGIANVDPKSDNGTLAGGSADVGDSTRPIFTFEYFVRDNLGIELLASTPFQHDVSIDGIGYAGNVRHLPPTLSLNYHFPTGSAWKPYVGAGVNYTAFFDETTPLGGGNLNVEDSIGFSAQAGIDYQFSDTGAIRLNVRWFDIESDVKLDGAKIGTADIDPILIGVSYVHKF